MPHRPTQQHHLNLASPEPYPSSILGGGSTPSKHPKPTATKFSHNPKTAPQNPDLIQPSNKPPSSSFMLKHFSSLNIISHKPRPLQKPSQTSKNHHLPHPPPPPPPLVDTHLQGKATASSAIAIAPQKLTAKRPTKDKPLKCKKEVERRKLDDDEGVKKKKGSSHLGLHHHHNSKVLFEDDVEKNSRVNIPPVVEEEEHDDDDDEDDVVVKRHSVSLAHHPSNGGCGGVNRRRSFCGSHVVVDLCDVFAVNGVKVVSADMPPFMQIHAVDCARKALDSMEKFTSKTLALTLKKEFDGVYGPAWHCIVGTNFGSFVTHSVGGFLYFSMDQKYYILLFKTAVQKAG